mmetsp:Transcript_6129/g.10909  ORF Transcript_6129/g.10909 Transcript_6129/m.10909 type:complete len:121 (-) Transcript_6129:123-485(-)
MGMRLFGVWTRLGLNGRREFSSISELIPKLVTYRSPSLDPSLIGTNVDSMLNDDGLKMLLKSSSDLKQHRFESVEERISVRIYHTQFEILYSITSFDAMDRYSDYFLFLILPSDLLHCCV